MNIREALSQIESGNNDHAVGRAGEVSRFQIIPTLWYQAGGHGKDFTDPDQAWQVAYHILNTRIIVFTDNHKRKPTTQEIYVLWNAPGQINNPSKTVAERAARFENLVNAKP